MHGFQAWLCATRTWKSPADGIVPRRRSGLASGPSAPEACGFIFVQRWRWRIRMRISTPGLPSAGGSLSRGLRWEGGSVHSRHHFHHRRRQHRLWPPVRLLLALDLFDQNSSMRLMTATFLSPGLVDWRCGVTLPISSHPCLSPGPYITLPYQTDGWTAAARLSPSATRRPRHDECRAAPSGDWHSPSPARPPSTTAGYKQPESPRPCPSPS
ncbi:hypothetical protein BGZ61DRAFT_178280 [Ilyonectria robusta]|uniref:uncharacterized protein n=1 Tax=Ilyonectria robusta TaxID=1079257 RepID=UPI001E8D9BAF|nr:uncharacterized protein BGZ61DRAFT_178280 [Ilyonectria robusta]KAH8729225.1 hypothetical protein BGZ61DRAFT_178280 [Ilyonectria robusta]